MKLSLKRWLDEGPLRVDHVQRKRETLPPLKLFHYLVLCSPSNIFMNTKILTWNCRSLLNPRMFTHLQDMIASLKPGLFCLVET